MIPAAFVVLDELPLTANGKVDRGALPAVEGTRTALSASYVAARNDTEKELVRIWETVLGITNIGVRDNFFELGGNSLLAVRLFAQTAESLGNKLPLSTLFRAATIELLARVVHEGISDSESSLVALQPHGDKPPLYCLHACGPHVFPYLPLVRHLDADQPVYGLQARGIDGRDEPFTQVSDMAAHYVKEMRQLQPRGPYYLLGDTLGGLFAFEVARVLREQGEPVALLAMIDTHCPLPLSLWRRLACQRVYLREKGLRRFVSEGLRDTIEQLDLKLWKIVRNRDQGIGRLLTPKVRTAGRAAKRMLVRAASRFKAPGGVEVEMPSLIDDPIARTEQAIAVAVQEEYCPPKKPYPGRITYFLAEQSLYKLKYRDNRLDWKKLADELEIHEFPAGHDTIREEPHVASVALKLKACMERARQSTQQSSLKLFLTCVWTGTIAALALEIV
jgi:thioesterase domain-containing protein